MTSLELGLAALAAMDENAARVREVATRLLEEHSGRLPELMAVRLESSYQSHIALQPFTEADVRSWAEALGASEVTVAVAESEGGFVKVYSSTELMVDGVGVRIGTCEWLSPSEWAARPAGEVSS